MSKRNIAYIKPKDPSFLAQLKQQIGYNDGPSVDTKRQKLEDLDADSNDSTEDRPEREDEKPQVVVLKTGDLTAEEAAAEEKRLAKDAEETPADLNLPIVFRKRHKPNTESDAALASNKTEKVKKKKNIKTSRSNNKAKLSFNADDDDDDDDEQKEKEED